MRCVEQHFCLKFHSGSFLLTWANGIGKSLLSLHNYPHTERKKQSEQEGKKITGITSIIQAGGAAAFIFIRGGLCSGLQGVTNTLHSYEL